MSPLKKGIFKRTLPGLVLACGAAGCAVYGPPVGAYDPYYSYGPPVYPGAPVYAGPPVSIGLGFSYYDRGYWGGRGYGGGWHHRGYRGGPWGHGYRGGTGSHGWRGR